MLFALLKLYTLPIEPLATKVKHLGRQELFLKHLGGFIVLAGDIVSLPIVGP
jgi:hypothetical protein